MSNTHIKVADRHHTKSALFKDLALKFVDPNTLPALVVLGTPMLAIFFLSILFASMIFVYGSFIATATTNTPCFLNYHDLLLFQNMQLQVNAFMFNMPIAVLHDMGVTGIFAHYLELLMLTIVLQIAVSYWLVYKSPANLIKITPIKTSQLTLIITFSMLFLLILTLVMPKVSQAYDFHKLSLSQSDRLFAYELKIPLAKAKEVDSLRIAKHFDIEPVVVDQCPLSNNVHLIPADQKSYIGLN